MVTSAWKISKFLRREICGPKNAIFVFFWRSACAQNYSSNPIISGDGSHFKFSQRMCLLMVSFDEETYGSGAIQPPEDSDNNVRHRSWGFFLTSLARWQQPQYTYCIILWILDKHSTKHSGVLMFNRLNGNNCLNVLAAFSCNKHEITWICSRQHVSQNQHRFLQALFELILQ